MTISESSLKESFARVKEDLMRLEAKIIDISGKHAEILLELQELRHKGAVKISKEKKKSS